MRLIVHSDGAARGNPGPAAIAYVIADESGRVLEERGEPIGDATNNVAEYRAALAALEAARRLGARRVLLRSDSELLVRQLRGEYRTRASHLAELGARIEQVVRAFEAVEFEHVPREANARADALANRALDAALGRPGAAAAAAPGGDADAAAPGGTAAEGGEAEGGGAPDEPADAAGRRAPDEGTGRAPTGGPAGGGPESGHGEACLLRVRYGETDQMGVVYYANYFDWFTEARTELMRRYGIAYALLERRGVYLPVREAHCEYLRPARYDQRVAVYARVTRLTRTRLDFAYEVRLVEDVADAPGPPARTGAGRAGLLLATGWTRHVFVDGRGRPFDLARRYPELWERLQRVIGPEQAEGAQDGSV